MNCRAVSSVFLAAVLAVTARSGVAISAQTSANQRVLGERFVANLWLPPGKGPYAGVLVVGGSGGGIAWQDYWGDILASQGFAALALAYFGMEGLPKELDEIPLEYFLGALEYMQRKPEIDRTRIGVRRGFERRRTRPAVSVPRTCDPCGRRIRAQLCVFQSGAQHGGGSEASIIVDVPRTATSIRPARIRQYRRAARQRVSPSAQATGSRDERNDTSGAHRGPILLLSGKEDTTWPSSDMSEMVIARLRERNFRFAYQHIAYEDAGHMIHQRRSDAVKRGGTERGNNLAQQDAATTNSGLSCWNPGRGRESTVTERPPAGASCARCYTLPSKEGAKAAKRSGDDLRDRRTASGRTHFVDLIEHEPARSLATPDG